MCLSFSSSLPLSYGTFTDRLVETCLHDVLILHTIHWVVRGFCIFLLIYSAKRMYVGMASYNCKRRIPANPEKLMAFFFFFSPKGLASLNRLLRLILKFEFCGHYFLISLFYQGRMSSVSLHDLGLSVLYCPKHWEESHGRGAMSPYLLLRRFWCWPWPQNLAMPVTSPVTSTLLAGVVGEDSAWYCSVRSEYASLPNNRILISIPDLVGFMC